MVDRSKLSPYLFLDSKNIDRLTKSTIDLKPRTRNFMDNSEKLFDSSLSLNNFQQLVHATSNGLVLHPHASPATQNLFKEASKLAASVPTPNSSSETKKVWDKFVTYAKNRSLDPLEASSDHIVT